MLNTVQESALSYPPPPPPPQPLPKQDAWLAGLNKIHNHGIFGYHSIFSDYSNVLLCVLIREDSMYFSISNSQN